MTQMWYLYAIAGEPPPGLPGGVGGEPVVPLMQDSICLLVSPYVGDPHAGAAHGDLLAHRRVIETAMQRTTVLPFDFGTVVDEPACAAFVARYGARIRQQLARLSGHVEVTLEVRGAGESPAGGWQRRAAELAAELQRLLGPWAAASRLRLLPSEHVLLSLTHLVHHSALGPWAEAAARVREAHPRLEFAGTGPWPPYHFGDVTDPDAESARPK